MTQNNITYIFKQFFSVVLTLAVLLLALPAWSLPAAAAEPTFVADGDGESEATAYLISTPQQLQALAEDVNNGITYAGKYFKLKNEIYLSAVCGESINGEEVSWTPIGCDSSNSFQGIFDGGKNTIKELYINEPNSTKPQGLFGYISSNKVENNGTVKNLTVEGSVSVKGPYDEGVSGIVGRNEKGKVEHCINNVAVTGDASRIGGIVGRNDGTIDDCTNNAKITGTNSAKSYTGGIAGESRSGCTVKNCRNNGTVDGYSCVGGIVGGNTGTVENCINNAEATVKGGKNMVGGVVGCNDKGTVKNCSNEATVTGGTVNNGKVTAGGNHVGGVVGQNNATVEICFNTGEVTGYNSHVGGVVGENTVNGTVRVCYNIGNVNGGYGTVNGNNVGGVVGHNLSELNNCYNIGAVDGKGSGVGGIVGNNDAGNVTNCYSVCYNVGDVKGGSNTGAAFGQNTGTITNCFFFIAPGETLEAAIGSGAGSSSVKQASAEEFAADKTFTGVSWAFNDNAWVMGYTDPPEPYAPVRPILKPIPEHPLTPLPVASSGDNTGGGSTGDNTDGGDEGDNEDDPSQPPTDGGNTGGNTGGGNTGGGNTGGGNTGGGTTRPPSTGSTSTPSGSTSKPSGSTGAGDINIGTESGPSAPEATIGKESSSKLKEEVTSEHLTEKEKSALESGDTIDIILRVEDAEDTVSSEHRQTTEAALADTGFTVGGYLDIELIKRINGAEVGKIPEISSPINVTIEIPEELRKANRSYALVRVTNGIAEIFEDIDGDPYTITIAINKFSTYSIVYKDTKPANPSTGASVTVIALAVAVSAAAVTVRRKKSTE